MAVRREAAFSAAVGIRSAEVTSKMSHSAAQASAGPFSFRW
jgi:hypothetical protein